jgi:hypothetical protein
MIVVAGNAGQMVAEVIAEVVKVQAPRFASLTYRNEAGELSTYTLMLGINDVRAYQRDLALVIAYLKRFDLSPLMRKAAEEIGTSLAESLTNGIGNNSRYVHGKHAADTYVEIFPGIKVNKGNNPEDAGTVYLMAYRYRKVVHEAGVYPEVNSRPLTIAKRQVRKLLGMRTERIRQFKVRCTARAAMNGKILVLQDA